MHRREITGLSRIERISVSEESELCWKNLPDIPWSLSYYMSEWGQSNFHIYLWLAKDLSWVQSWYWPAYIFGSLTILWQLFIVGKTISRRNNEDIIVSLTILLWLGALFWMTGELEDYKYPNRKSVYDQRTLEAGYADIFGLACISTYFLLIKPFNLYKESLKVPTEQSKELTIQSNRKAIRWRFPWYFHSWEEYENIHVLFWLAKDTSWNWNIGPLVVVFFVPTFTLACDFVWITLFQKKEIIDHCHYLAQLLWVCYASTWAAGEFFLTPNNDNAHSMVKWNHETRNTSRWFAGWILVCAYIPIIVLHMIWIPATIMNIIPPNKKQKEEEGAIREPLNPSELDTEETC